MQKGLSWRYAVIAGSILCSTLMVGNAKAQEETREPQSTLIIPLAPAVAVQKETPVYHCTGPHSLLQKLPAGDFPVTYLNAGAVSLVVFPVDGQTLVFTNVMSASGAKYVADRFVWWTKGQQAFFSEDRADAGSPSVCEEVKISHTGTEKQAR